MNRNVKSLSNIQALYLLTAPQRLTLIVERTHFEVIIRHMIDFSFIFGYLFGEQNIRIACYSNEKVLLISFVLKVLNVLDLQENLSYGIKDCSVNRFGYTTFFDIHFSIGACLIWLFN
jgi:hypothetical protein